MGDRYSVRPNWGFWLRERERERELNGLKNQDQAQVVKEEAYFEADMKENCEFQCV